MPLMINRGQQRGGQEQRREDMNLDDNNQQRNGVSPTQSIELDENEREWGRVINPNQIPEPSGARHEIGQNQQQQ